MTKRARDVEDTEEHKLRFCREAVARDDYFASKTILEEDLFGATRWEAARKPAEVNPLYAGCWRLGPVCCSRPLLSDGASCIR